jgi:hypothetical protein
MADARDDPHADWYAGYVRDPAATHTRATAAALAEMLGEGRGRCRASGAASVFTPRALRGPGWRVLGPDLSLGQLRHARGALPVVSGDSAAPPASSGAAVATLTHTDVSDRHGTVREAARAPRPGGLFADVGVPASVRASGRVGHRTLSELLDAVTGAGLRRPGWRRSARERYPACSASPRSAADAVPRRVLVRSRAGRC